MNSDRHVVVDSSEFEAARGAVAVTPEANAVAVAIESVCGRLVTGN